MSRFRWLTSGGFATIVLTLSVLLAAIPANAGPIPWHKNLGEARRVASTSGKPLVVVVGAKWCSYCEKMKQQTLSDPAVSRQVTENFVPVLLDADDQNDEARQLNANELPTIVILSSAAKVLTKVTGFQSPAQLSALLAQYRPTRPTRQFHLTRYSFLTTHSARVITPAQPPAEDWGYGTKPSNLATRYQSITLPAKQTTSNRGAPPVTDSTKTGFLRSHTVRPQSTELANTFALSTTANPLNGTGRHGPATLSPPLPPDPALHSPPQSPRGASSFLRAHSTPLLTP